MVGSPGFEPGSREPKAYRVQVDWEAFKTYLLKTHTRENALNLYRYARKYYRFLFSPAEIHLFSQGKQRMIMAALSNLSKFLGRYEAWRTAVRSAGLRWNSGVNDFIIERIKCDLNQIISWVRDVKRAAPNLAVFVNFTALSGLRFIESINSYNLIREMASAGRLNEYYDKEKCVLNHYKFGFFMRKSKRVYITFMEPEIVLEITKSMSLSKWKIIRTLQRRGLKIRFKNLRKLWATFMTKYLTPAEIDFLQGRATASIFMKHYFSPTMMINNLKDRVLRGISEIRGMLT